MRDRRAFFRFLAGSPLLHGWQAPAPPATPAEAISLADFEEAARRVLPPAHFGYLATGVDDDRTVRANLEGFTKLRLRARRLIDVSRIDTGVTVFGTRWASPIALAPVGSQRAFHEEGEVAVARAARSTGTVQILSTMTTRGIEEVSQAAGSPVWFQLYSTGSLAAAGTMVRRAEAAGSPVVVLTVDRPASRNAETQMRAARRDPRPCAACHETQNAGFFRRKAMFRDIDMTKVVFANPGLTWKYLEELRRITRMKLVVKGISTREDALLCREAGVDGVIVSNHGGRAEESGMGTIDSLPEVAEAIGGRLPVLVDGGIRRGTDVFKALALGATAVCIGRPYVWGLSAFGEAGVERVIGILRGEFEVAMRQCGTRTVGEIGAAFVARA